MCRPAEDTFSRNQPKISDWQTDWPDVVKSICSILQLPLERRHPTKVSLVEIQQSSVLSVCLVSLSSWEKSDSFGFTQTSRPFHLTELPFEPSMAYLACVFSSEYSSFTAVSLFGRIESTIYLCRITGEIKDLQLLASECYYRDNWQSRKGISPHVLYQIVRKISI